MAKSWLDELLARMGCADTVTGCVAKRSDAMQRMLAVAARRTVAELTVLYDGACNLCRASVVRVRRMDPHSRIELLDLHDANRAARFPQINVDEAMRQMQAVDPRGRVYSGADAWARIGLALPGWKLIAWLLLVPGIHFIAQRVYDWIARNRYRWNRELCEDGTCALHVARPSDPQNADNKP